MKRTGYEEYHELSVYMDVLRRGFWCWRFTNVQHHAFAATHNR